MREVRIGGDRYRIRYTLPQKVEIERQLNAERPGGVPLSVLDVMFTNNTLFQAIVVWGGIKGADPEKRITPDQVVNLLQRHIEAKGNVLRDVYKPCVYELCESGVMGEVNMDHLATTFAKAGAGDPGEDPKEQADSDP